MIEPPSDLELLNLERAARPGGYEPPSQEEIANWQLNQVIRELKAVDSELLRQVQEVKQWINDRNPQR